MEIGWPLARSWASAAVELWGRRNPDHAQDRVPDE
jgi:hypothetical protein